MPATMLRSTDPGAPVLGNQGEGFFELLQYCLSPLGWTFAITHPEGEDAVDVLNLTPSQGPAGVLQLEKRTEEYGGYGWAYFHPIVPTLFYDNDPEAGVITDLRELTLENGDWQDSGVEHFEWVLVADEKSFVFLTGSPRYLWDSGATTYDFDNLEYALLLAYGAVQKPDGEEWFLVVGDGDGSSAETVGPDYWYFGSGTTYSALVGMLIEPGSEGWGPPPLPGKPWTMPERVFRSHWGGVWDDGDGMYKPDLIGFLPFLEIMLSWLDPAEYPSGTQISATRWMFNGADGAGSLILHVDSTPVPIFTES